MSQHASEMARWLSAARGGSQEALGQALEACRGYLLLVAQRELDPALHAKGGASDLVQETFLEAQRDFPRFQGTSETELLAWMRRLLLNNLANFARRYRDTDKRQLGREVALDAEQSTSTPAGAVRADTPTPSVQAMAHEQAQALQRALERLPEDYRQVITLRYQEERSFEEIGAQLKRTPNAARKLWARALERLQEEMEGLL
jgi:RNA polymerase sigma-70 factor (ECF subfamily)